MDGINQRESVQWRKFIDSMSQALADLGGKLVFSCRTLFFRNNLRARLVAPIELVEVPEWTVSELETLLEERGTSSSKLSSAVAEFLRNPRIISVAAELLNKGQIEKFSELSVSRLLFDHIRMGASPLAEQLPLMDFVGAIRQHADEIDNRLKKSQAADLKIFERSVRSGHSELDLSLTDQFALTSDGRFFEYLADDYRLYALKDDGLPLALGLSLLGAARRAQRNHMSIEDELATILDPIGALDNTADVLISALIAAVLGDDTPNEIVAALVKAFIGGLARFQPEAAIATIRRFAIDALTRNNEDFRPAVFLLKNHTAALDDATAIHFVEKASQIANDTLSIDDKEMELFVASQKGLEIAFPHMEGNEQLCALAAYPKVDNILVTVCDLMKPCDPIKYQAALEKAYVEGDTVNLFRLMVFGEYTDTPISHRLKAIVSDLVVSTDRRVRVCAMGLVRRLKDATLLQLVAATDWDASKLDSASDNFEIWYGSDVLVLAAEQGLLTVEECLSRIGASGYLSLVRKLGRPAALAVASRIDAGISEAISYNVSANLPDIERHIESEQRPAWLDVSDKLDPLESSSDRLRRMAESKDTWYERHRLSQDAVEAFERQLTQAGAQLIIQPITADLVREIFNQDPLIVEAWYQRFISLDSGLLSAVHNIALPVAQIIAKSDPKGAVKLFEMLSASEPLIRITFGSARVSFDAETAWSAEEGAEIRNFRFKRLDNAQNDYVISVEVLAAISAGKQNDLREYVMDRRSRPEPTHNARAVTVSGLCEDYDWALDTIKAFDNCHGFLSKAYQSAKYSMDRYRWAKYWTKLITEARTEADLWRYQLIRSKIVDGRFCSEDLDGNSLLKQYGSTFNGLTRIRIEKWARKRKETLFGMNVPDQMFLVPESVP